MNQYKRCGKCHTIKDANFFYKDISKKDGLSSYCKDCRIEQSRSWRAANRDTHRDYSSRWFRANSERAKASAKIWSSKNPEKVIAAKKKWAAKNPQASRLKTLRRRAALKEALVVTQKDIQKMLAKPCVYCGSKSEHIDHVIPLAKGGRHSLGNLVQSCATCNLQKGGRFIMQWRIAQSKLAPIFRQ